MGSLVLSAQVQMMLRSKLAQQPQRTDSPGCDIQGQGKRHHPYVMTSGAALASLCETDTIAWIHVSKREGSRLR
jgi:hypothetical protein